MKQSEYWEMFEEENSLKGVSPKYGFSNGNHKRSRIGDKWFYYGETEDSFTLYRDEVVSVDEDYVYIHIYQEDRRLTDTPVAITHLKVHQMYPLQKIFSEPMEKREALRILRDHFIEESKRSTTNESE